jgi:hypothetical protein
MLSCTATGSEIRHTLARCMPSYQSRPWTLPYALSNKVLQRARVRGAIGSDLQMSTGTFSSLKLRAVDWLYWPPRCFFHGSVRHDTKMPSTQEVVMSTWAGTGNRLTSFALIRTLLRLARLCNIWPSSATLRTVRRILSRRYPN